MFQRPPYLCHVVTHERQCCYCDASTQKHLGQWTASPLSCRSLSSDHHRNSKIAEAKTLEPVGGQPPWSKCNYIVTPERNRYNNVITDSGTFGIAACTMGKFTFCLD